MTDTVDSAPCQGYWPGHHVHWIHARHAWSSKPLPVTDVIVHDNWIHFTCGGIRYSRWNHCANSIPGLLKKFPNGSVVFYKQWRILAVDSSPNGSTRRLFNLDTEPSSCVVSERENR